MKLKPRAILCVGLSSLGGIIYGKFAQIPTIFNISDTNKRSLELSNQTRRSFFGLKLTCFFEKTALTYATIITVPSQTAKAQLLKDYSISKDKRRYYMKNCLLE